MSDAGGVPRLTLRGLLVGDGLIGPPGTNNPARTAGPQVLAVVDATVAAVVAIIAAAIAPWMSLIAFATASPPH